MGRNSISCHSISNGVMYNGLVAGESIQTSIQLEVIRQTYPSSIAKTFDVCGLACCRCSCFFFFLSASLDCFFFFLFKA